jgi:hypothetical protein
MSRASNGPPFIHDHGLIWLKEDGSLSYNSSNGFIQLLASFCRRVYVQPDNAADHGFSRCGFLPTAKCESNRITFFSCHEKGLSTMSPEFFQTIVVALNLLIYHLPQSSFPTAGRYQNSSPAARTAGMAGYKTGQLS